MEPLPYFLLLLKKNALLYTIISTSSFSSINFNNTKHFIHSSQALDLIDYYIDDEHFERINILITEENINLTFHTSNSKFYTQPEIYFKRNNIINESQIYFINGIEIRTQKINLGKFIFLPPPAPPASIWVRKSSLYGYVISINFYTHNTK